LATSRKPEVILGEIEQTRAELAEAIDAITDRINPRRAASRGAQAVRSQVSSVRDRIGDELPSKLPTSSSLPEGSARPLVVAVAATAAVLLALVAIRRRR
jgi:hypothetical protein